MKIGLIAMSGIRACDTELLELGLTLQGFVERSKQIASLPSLGLLTLAGMTPSKHEVHYIEIPDLQAEGETLEPFYLVAISSYSAQINEGYELARRYRASGIPVVMGGTHVTARPEEALQYCTSVVIGEGEASWPVVVADAERGQLKSCYGSYDVGFDLADAPMPAFELLDLSKYNRLTVQTSRGCPHRCEFCAGSNLISRRYKQKPIAKVLAEIDQICALWEHPFIEFADDNSFVNRAYWKKLLPQLKQRHIKWFTETDLSVAHDPELLRMMRESGCAQVLIGLESPTAAPLDNLEQNSNWKHACFADYKESIRTIQSHGITVNGCFIIGLDGQTPAVFDDIYDFVRDAELYEVQITILTPFPGTPLYARLEQEGRLIDPTNCKRCTLFDLNFTPQGMSGAALVAGFHRLAMKLYSDSFTQWRRDTFKQNLRNSVARRRAA